MPHIQIYRNLENDEIGSLVSFPAVVDGQEMTCVISHQALEDHLGARHRGDHEYATSAHWPKIRTLAHQLIIEERFEEGKIIMRSADMAKFLLS